LHLEGESWVVVILSGRVLCVAMALHDQSRQLERAIF
jgi:hypothetical protein